MSHQRAARWLGGTLAAVCEKAGEPPALETLWRFEKLLRCPDCRARLERNSTEGLVCAACGYESPSEGDVYNLLPSLERRELYPGDRDDIADFSLPSHEKHLIDGWYELEGVHGNKYRWIGGRASLRLGRVKPGPQRLRIRGHASPQSIPGEVHAVVNGAALPPWTLDRPGLFVLEADVPQSDGYTVEIQASPTFTVPTDDRTFSVNLSMIRLIDRD
jgi:hypothetical protein